MQTNQVPVPLFDLKISGKLHVLASPPQEQRQRLTFWIEHAKAESLHSGDHEAQIAVLTGELARPYEVNFERGLVSGIALPDKPGMVTVSVIRSIAAGLQRSSDAPAGKSSFETSEYDSTGRYVARNEIGKPDSLRKQKLRYEELLSRSDNAAGAPVKAKPILPTIASSEIDMRPERGVPSAVTLKEEVHVPVMDGTTLETKTQLELKLIAKHEGAKAPAWSGARVTLAAREPYLEAPKLAALDSMRIDGRSFEDVLADLEAIAKDYEPEKLVDNPKDQPSDADKAHNSERALARNRAFSALNALVRSKPETVAQMVEKIRAGSPAARWLISGLAASGSAEAQVAIVGLIHDAKLDETLGKSAALSLLQANNPTPAAGKAIEALLGEERWRQFAFYGVGTLARRLREVGEVKEGERLAAVIVAELARAKDSATMQDALGGLANAADPKSLRSISPYLTHDESDVRRSAVTALRLIEDPQVEPLIIARLSKDDAVEVRTAAIEAAGKHSATSEKLTLAVEKAASSDAEVRVRIAAVRALGKWLPERPALRGALQRISEQDKDPNVLLLAKAALEANAG